MEAAMLARQQMIDDGMAEALSDFTSRASEDCDPFDLINRSVLKRVPDAAAADFQQAARRWIVTNRDFGRLIVDLALKFANAERPDETVRGILKRADACGSIQAKTLLNWFTK